MGTWSHYNPIDSHYILAVGKSQKNGIWGNYEKIKLYQVFRDIKTGRFRQKNSWPKFPFKSASIGPPEKKQAGDSTSS